MVLLRCYSAVLPCCCCRALFDTTLEGVLRYEAKLFPEAAEAGSQVPALMTALMKAVEEADGLKTEGIFRVAADANELNALRKALEASGMVGWTIDFGRRHVDG